MKINLFCYIATNERVLLSSYVLFQLYIECEQQRITFPALPAYFNRLFFDMFTFSLFIFLKISKWVADKKSSGFE